MNSITRNPALAKALEEGVEALFKKPVSAPFRKTLSEGVELVMDFRSGAHDPLTFACEVRHEDGRVEAFDYS